jgi:hypothetical protein
MLTRSLNYYGPIPDAWGKKIQELLIEIKKNEGFLTDDCLKCVDLLAAESKKRMEEMLWTRCTLRRLHDLEVELNKLKGGWALNALELARELALQIRGI